MLSSRRCLFVQLYQFHENAACVKLVAVNPAPGAPYLTTPKTRVPALAPTIAPRRFKAANEGVLRYAEPGGFYQPPVVLPLTLDELARKTSGVSWSKVADMRRRNESNGDPVGSDGFGYFAKGEYPDSRVKGAVTFLARVRVAWARRRRGFGDGPEKSPLHPPPNNKRASPESTTAAREGRKTNSAHKRAGKKKETLNETRRFHAERQAEVVSGLNPSEERPTEGPTTDDWWRFDESWEQYSFRRSTCHEHDEGGTDTGLTLPEAVESAIDGSFVWDWTDAYRPDILDELEKRRADNAASDREIRDMSEAFDRYVRQVAQPFGADFRRFDGKTREVTQSRTPWPRKGESKKKGVSTMRMSTMIAKRSKQEQDYPIQTHRRELIEEISAALFGVEVNVLFARRHPGVVPHRQTTALASAALAGAAASAAVRAFESGMLGHADAAADDDNEGSCVRVDPKALREATAQLLDDARWRERSDDGRARADGDTGATMEDPTESNAKPTTTLSDFVSGVFDARATLRRAAIAVDLTRDVIGPRRGYRAMDARGPEWDVPGRFHRQKDSAATDARLCDIANALWNASEEKGVRFQADFAAFFAGALELKAIALVDESARESKRLAALERAKAFLKYPDVPRALCASDDAGDFDVDDQEVPPAPPPPPPGDSGDPTEPFVGAPDDFELEDRAMVCVHVHRPDMREIDAWGETALPTVWPNTKAEVAVFRTVRTMGEYAAVDATTRSLWVEGTLGLVSRLCDRADRILSAFEENATAFASIRFGGAYVEFLPYVRFVKTVLAARKAFGTPVPHEEALENLRERAARTIRALMVAYQQAPSAHERAKGGVRFVIARAKTPLKLALDAFERRERRRDPTRRRFKYYYAGDGTSCCHPLEGDESDAWFGLVPIWDPKVTARDLGVAHDFHIYVMDDDDDNDEEEEEKEKPSGDASGKKAAAAAHRNIPTGPPKNVLPAHLATVFLERRKEEETRRLRGEGGGDDTLIGGGGGGSAKNPSAAAAAFFGGARPTSISDEDAEAAMLAGFRSARNFTEWYANISDFDCPGHAQSGFPQTAPGNGPERSRYFPRFALTAEEGLFVYKMNRVLVALGVMDPATGNRKPKTPAAMRRLYEHPFHAALKGVKGYQARGEAAFAGGGGIPRAALDEGVSMHMFIGWLEGANDLGDFFRFEGTPRDDARLALLAARFLDDLSHSRHTPGKLALVQSIAEARPELLDDFRDVLQRAIEAGAEPSLPFTADFKSPFERDLFIDGKDPENEDRSKFFDFLVKNRDKIDEARDVLDVIDRGGDDRGGGRPNHRTTDSSDEDEDDESEDSWSDEEYTRARDGRRAARPSDPARTDLEKAREKQIRKRNRESARREAKRREEERKRLEREKRLAEKEAQKRAKKAADAERRRAAEAKSAEEKKRADDAVAELVAKRVRERLAKKQQQEDSRANWQQKKSPDGLAEAEMVEKAAEDKNAGERLQTPPSSAAAASAGGGSFSSSPSHHSAGVVLGRCAAAGEEGGGGGPGGGGGGMCRELLPDLGDGFAEETDRVAELSRYVEVRCAAGCVVRAHVACYRAWVASRNDKEEGKKDGKEGKDGEGDTKAGASSAGASSEDGASSVAASPAASSSSLCDVTDFPCGCACPSSAGGGSFCRASVVSAFRRHRGVASDVLASSVEAAAARRREEAEVKAKKAQEAEARKAQEARRKAEADAERARAAAKKKAEADLARAEAKRTAEAARAAKRLEAEKAEAEARRQAELAAERRAEAERRRVEAREAEAAERAAARERELRIEREREARRREEKSANRARKLRETAEERRCEAVRVERSRRALASREEGAECTDDALDDPEALEALPLANDPKAGDPSEASSSVFSSPSSSKKAARSSRAGGGGDGERGGVDGDSCDSCDSCERVVRAFSPIAQLYRVRTVVFPTPAECASICDEAERHAETEKFLDALHGVGYLFEYERERTARNNAASWRGSRGGAAKGSSPAEGDEESSDVRGEDTYTSAAADAAFPDRRWPIVRVVKTTPKPMKTKKKKASSKKSGGTGTLPGALEEWHVVFPDADSAARCVSGFPAGPRFPPNRPAVIAPGREVIEAIDDAIERGDLVPEDVDASAWDALHVTHPQIAARAFFSLREKRRAAGVLEEEGEGSSSQSSTPPRTDVVRLLQEQYLTMIDAGTPTGRRRRETQRAKERTREEEAARRAEAREREERRRAEEAEMEEAEREASSRMSSRASSEASSRTSSAAPSSARAPPISAPSPAPAPSLAPAPVVPLSAFLPLVFLNPGVAARWSSLEPGVGGRCVSCRAAVPEPHAATCELPLRLRDDLSPLSSSASPPPADAALRMIRRDRPGWAPPPIRAWIGSGADPSDTYLGDPYPPARRDATRDASSRVPTTRSPPGSTTVADASDDASTVGTGGSDARGRSVEFGRRSVGDPSFFSSSSTAALAPPAALAPAPVVPPAAPPGWVSGGGDASAAEHLAGLRRVWRDASQRPEDRPPHEPQRGVVGVGIEHRAAHQNNLRPNVGSGPGPPSSSPFGSAGTAGDASFGMPRTRAAMPTPFFHDAPPPGARSSSSPSSRGTAGYYAGPRSRGGGVHGGSSGAYGGAHSAAPPRHPPPLSPHRNPLGPDPDAVDDDDLCPICCVAVLDETDRAFRPCTSASCAFVACLQCVKQMQETDDQKGKCPMCRGAYDEDEMRKLMGGGMMEESESEEESEEEEDTEEDE